MHSKVNWEHMAVDLNQYWSCLKYLWVYKSVHTPPLHISHLFILSSVSTFASYSKLISLFYPLYSKPYQLVYLNLRALHFFAFLLFSCCKLISLCFSSTWYHLTAKMFWIQGLICLNLEKLVWFNVIAHLNQNLMSHYWNFDPNLWFHKLWSKFYCEARAKHFWVKLWKHCCQALMICPLETFSLSAIDILLCLRLLA